MILILNFREPTAFMIPKTNSVIAATAIAVLAILTAFATPSARAADDPPHLMFNGTAVQPATLSVPANTPIKLLVTNTSAAAIEFESFELHRERVVQPGQTITVLLPELSPGTYPFFDDFSHGTVKGEIVTH
jgi:heme/copper-type cytochrome/quinol oxidase subunit 2